MLLYPKEGDTLCSPSGVVTCTETGSTVVVHGNKLSTMTTPAVKIDRSWKIERGGKDGAD